MLENQMMSTKIPQRQTRHAQKTTESLAQTEIHQTSMQNSNQRQNGAIVGKGGIIIVKQKIEIRMVRMYRRERERLAKGLGAYGLLA
jgi:hypothetical protein